jgi:hypothetical protein
MESKQHPDQDKPSYHKLREKILDCFKHKTWILTAALYLMYYHCISSRRWLEEPSKALLFCFIHGLSSDRVESAASLPGFLIAHEPWKRMICRWQ